MSYLNDMVGSLVGQQISIGLSAIIGVTVLPGQVRFRVDRSPVNGGTLWIGGATLSWNNGYHIPTTALGGLVPDQLLFKAAGTLYMCAAGATVVLYMLQDRSVGIPDV